jgi:hypothetical protein
LEASLQRLLTDKGVVSRHRRSGTGEALAGRGVEFAARRRYVSPACKS